MKSYLGWKIDFTEPKGEPALCAPDSLSWRIYKNPIAGAIGGVSAVLMEFADARIRSGVWDHSVFKDDPVGRGQRTGLTGALGIYGPQSAARRVIQGVTNMHSRVKGQTPKGEDYYALDVELLDWVSATASFGVLSAYNRFVRPLSEAEIRQALAEGEASARLFGVKDPLRDFDHFQQMLDKLSPRFEAHDINTEFLDIMRSGRAAPKMPLAPQRALVHAAVEILPIEVRTALELGPEFNMTLKDRLIIWVMAQMGEYIPNKKGFAADACERMGLPRDFLWKSKRAQKRLLEQNGLATSATVPAE